MKKNYILFLAIILALLLQSKLFSQCGAITPLGSASNMFTLIRNSTSSIAANKALNTIVMIHRNDATAFGGNSGHLRCDISTNGGANWSLNQGVMNPICNNPARYPNVAIYNPANNTNTASAYFSYMAPTISTVTAGWANIIATGVTQSNGSSGATETYNQNGIGGTQYQPSSLVTGSTGVLWAIDWVSTGNGFSIYKGVWNSGLSDVVWNVNYSVTPAYNYLANAVDGDMNVAFDPTGTIGYFCFAAHLTTGPSDPTIYPVLYKTTDGGASWTGPIIVDITKFSCITTNTASGYYPSITPGSDLVVDASGNPHIITTLGNSSSYVFNYSLWHHMYDITLKNGLWVAYDLGNANCGPYTPAAGATQWLSPQAGRTADGTKVFFTWADNSSASVGSSNSSPDLFGKALNVTTGSWTPTKNFTSCNPNATGKIFWSHIAAEVLEPNSTTFLVPTMYGEMSGGDPNNAATFKYLDNVTFATSEFTITPPPATVTISPPGPLLVCQNGSLTLSVSNTAQAVWSNSATTTSITISSGTVSTYSVIAQVGCNVGTASVAVTNMTVNASAVTPSVCPGNMANFMSVGNALGYTWTPGSVTGTNVSLGPLSTNVVTLTALGSGSCTSEYTVPINILPVPTLTIAGNNTICAGSTLSQTVSGASTYLWSDNSTSATFTDIPTSNTTYTVTGTAANTCTNTQTVSVYIKPTPTINIASTSTVACVGETIGVLATGASSFQWAGGPATGAYTITAGTTSAYTVTGTGTNQCQTDKVLNLTIYAIPNLTITAARPKFCKGEKIKITASGASTYTWSGPASFPSQVNSTVQVNPTVTTTYTIIGKSTDGCRDTIAYALVVDACAGIDNFGTQSSSVSIYPNPAKDEFTVKSEFEMKLTIFNELGQFVKTVSLTEENSYQVEVKDLEQGIYFINGQNSEGAVRQKVIITH
ncbi:MAG: T9SS type A sorting domain-containing protein [Bacteroidia bacterium]|nr:T9SS type A sorting domain-containing protein [Bacteroidia bacterium]